MNKTLKVVGALALAAIGGSAACEWIRRRKSVSGGTMKSGAEILPVHLESMPSDVLDALRTSKPVLIVGSAASIFAPTNLPNGKSITEQLVEWLAGEPHKWPAWLKADAKLLPFEAILDAYPDQSGLPDIVCRLYGNRNIEPNIVHKAIAEGLINGTFSALITTNYDLAFDNFFAEKSADISTIVREEHGNQWMDNPSTPPYWKIHGTARVDDAETIVSNLAREHRMELWKRNLLKHLVTGRKVIFLGYSGLDFDICPELCCIPENFEAVWLDVPPNKDTTFSPNANQLRVLQKRHGMVFLGDIRDLLSKLCGITVDHGPRRSWAMNAQDYFDNSQFGKWRIRLLNRLACPSICMKELDRLSVSPGDLFDAEIVRSHMLNHIGRYRDSLHILERRIVEAADSGVKLTRYLDAATAWLIYGSNKNFRRCLQSAKDLRSKIKILKFQRGFIAEAELLQWVRNYSLLGIIPFLRRAPCFRRWIYRNGRLSYLTALRAFQSTGLDGLYSIQHDAERIHVELREGFASAAELGFRALGLRIMESQKERDRIVGLESRLTESDISSCAKALRRARRYGWHPETWKWAWISIWYADEWNRKTWRIWYRSFRATQYTSKYQIAYLAQYLSQALVHTIRNVFNPPPSDA